MTKSSNPTAPPMHIPKSQLLVLATAAVADRGLNYGSPEDNFARIARRWNAHLANAHGVELTLRPVDVAIMCADLKLARLENQPNHLDSWVDLAGYAACGANIECEERPAADKPHKEPES